MARLTRRIRAGGAGDRGRRRAARVMLAALAVAQVLYGRGRRTPRATQGMVGLMLATSGVEAGRRGAVPMAAAGAIGFATELVGVATARPFGHYAYSDKLGPRVRGVPLLAAAAWAMMARPAWAVARRVSHRWRVPLAAAALTAWDVYLDPRMVREGYWSWPGGGRYEGVPASNFAGWFATGLGVFAVFAALDHSSDDDGGAVALYVWTWLGEGVANALVWRRPAVAAAGGLAMGAFAVPALVRRPERPARGAGAATSVAVIAVGKPAAVRR